MCEKGFLSGHKLAGLKMRLQDGANHIVDSSELAFYLATQGAIKQTFEIGNWHVLEPIMSVEVTGPVEFQVNCFVSFILLIYINISLHAILSFLNDQLIHNYNLSAFFF
jgi:hypothetical protein